jgi:tRNA nucleotidyltransferase (CCA-adding enzyme)
MEPLLRNVLRRVKPTESERETARRVADGVVRLVNRKCAELGVRANAALVGSIARGTWLRDEKDIDVFILFPEHLPREELEREGLRVARAVAGKSGQERYAEHPYVNMRYRGFDVDLVPCYDVRDPSRIKSAVDRTPHHQRYVQERLTDELRDEVLLTKAFMRGTGVYGAELKIQGFSGYLCELLTIHHGSFTNLVRAAAGWKPGTAMGADGKYVEDQEFALIFRDQPLVVIDPTDPNRNVAAPVSLRSFATFVRACQDFLSSPDEKFFFPRRIRPMTNAEIARALKSRGTRLILLAFRNPGLVPDVLYPQLRKTERAMIQRLGREGYQVIRSDVWANSMCVVLLELSLWRLPSVRTRLGPPVTFPGGDFIREHMSSKERLAGPFVDDAGRLVFELRRERTSAEECVRSAVQDSRSLGKNIAEAIRKGGRLLNERSMGGLLRDRGFRMFVSEYLQRCLPWYR